MCSAWAVAIRQAGGTIGFDRSTFHCQSRRTDQAAVAKRIREICETRVRYGYRHVCVLLEREGWVINV
jgi:putative transposase